MEATGASNLGKATITSIPLIGVISADWAGSEISIFNPVTMIIRAAAIAIKVTKANNLAMVLAVFIFFFFQVMCRFKGFRS